ncbi:hypothetical protein DRQ25_07920 [Candidatus Fermentibacteria bacterium]|nr:MAG: hypothetical protein DRQ25_07920 [Candidatus Fermentibacteria bacterium]
MRKFLPAAVILLVVALLYIPTLQTGFLTDDFLDCSHTLREVPVAFSTQYGGGYRPLMIFSWAMDNRIWSAENQTGWHVTNLILLLVSSLLVYIFLGRFLRKREAIYFGTALFMFSYPMAIAVARVSWSTTILALIPFLASLILISIWSRNSGKKWMPFAAAFLFLISLLVKETALAALPVMAMVAFCSSENESKWRKTIFIIITCLVPMVIYGVLRYRAMGFGVNYAESTTFGPFILRNILLQNSIVWQPWLFGASARLLVLIYPVAVYFGIPKWKNRILVFSLGIFLMLPVSNLTLRPDFSVAALPGSALFLGFLVQRLHGRKFLYPALAVFFAGIILFSIDEIRTLGIASDYLDRTTLRLAEIADELPGDGPLFVDGVKNEIGGYGTFWPGEYMAPMECLGIRPGRYVTGIDRIWEALSTENDSGFLIFLSNDASNYISVPVSLDMYTELPDTALLLTGSIPAGNLILYPSCLGTEESGALNLVSQIYPDSVITIVPEVRGRTALYDLAAAPLWLTSDETLVILVESPMQLVFSSRNVSLERALERMEAKQEH